MHTLIHQRVADARAGSNPAVVCQVPSGWVVLADMQFLPGYCILLADPVVGDLNALDGDQRATFLRDMAVIGDAQLEVCGAYRINYAILCNTEQALHAHILPRFLSEPDEMRGGLPWSYPTEFQQARPFDAGRDNELMQRLAQAIQSQRRK